SAVHQFCRIGKMSMIGATSKIVQDVVPFCIADGAPASVRVINKIGLERNGVDKNDVLEITRAFKSIFRSGETLEKVCSNLKEQYPDNEYVNEMVNFAISSERGIAR
ncbi:MAG: acyl-ACP--UDP-N-acetylglucosamine O-acyltransferase, partial [Lentisphaeria bacterium]